MSPIGPSPIRALALEMTAGDSEFSAVLVALELPYTKCLCVCACVFVLVLVCLCACVLVCVFVFVFAVFALVWLCV